MLGLRARTVDAASVSEDFCWRHVRPPIMTCRIHKNAPYTQGKKILQELLVFNTLLMNDASVFFGRVFFAVAPGH